MPDTCAMENANANVKRIDIMLFKDVKNIVKKDENVAAVFLFVSSTITKLEIET